MTTLIIPADLTVINSLTGIWGKSYSFLINHLTKLNLKVLKIFFPKATVLAWDKAISQNQLSQERQLSWQIVNQEIPNYFKDLNCLNINLLTVWQTYLAIHLSHKILSYHQALTRELDKKPTRIITLGFSHQEIIARFIAKSENNAIRYGVTNIQLPERLRAFADYLEKRQYPFMHPDEAPPIPKLMKSSYNELKKQLKDVQYKKKIPDFPKSGKMIKPLQILYDAVRLLPRFYKK